MVSIAIEPSLSLERESERQLITAAQAGDAEAFRQIVLAARPVAYRTALRFLRDHHEAEDIATDAMVRIHRALPKFRGDSSLSTWVFRITANLSRNRYHHGRRRGNGRSVSLDFTSDSCPKPLHDSIESAELPPLDILDQQEFARDVATARTRLRPKHGRILDLLCDHHMSYIQVAQALGIDLGTAKSRIARARAKLRSILEGIRS